MLIMCFPTNVTALFSGLFPIIVSKLQKARYFVVRDSCYGNQAPPKIIFIQQKWFHIKYFINISLES